MYLINGVALQNEAYGWRLNRASLPLPNLAFRVPSMERFGRDGVVPYAASREQTSFTFSVSTGDEYHQELLALFTYPELKITTEGDNKRVANGRLLSSNVAEYHPALGKYTHEFLVEIPEGMWRGTEYTSPKVTSNPTNATLDLFPDISAPVQDAQVTLYGPIEEPRVMDTGGSYFTILGTIPAGQSVRYDSGTGRAWLNTGSTTTEVSGQVETNGPRGVFEITPPANPFNRKATVTLTSKSYNTGAGFSVKGRPAYLI